MIKKAVEVVSLRDEDIDAKLTQKARYFRDIILRDTVKIHGTEYVNIAMKDVLKRMDINVVAQTMADDRDWDPKIIAEALRRIFNGEDLTPQTNPT